MVAPLPQNTTGRLARHLSAQGLPQIWGRGGFWQIGLRWWVAPIMFAGVAVGRWLGFEFPVLPVLAVAVASPIYNGVFAWLFSRYREELERDPWLDRTLTTIEVVIDYVVMLLLVYYAGGIASPLVLFFLFHVIIAAIQFRPSMAFLFAGLGSSGLWLLMAGQLMGWIPCHYLGFRGRTLAYLDEPVFAVVGLAFFTATLLMAAGMATRIMHRLRERMQALADVTRDVTGLNERLNSLYAMVCAIGSERHLQPVLGIVTSELARAMRTPVVAVQLLDDKDTTLRLEAAYGLPKDVLARHPIETTHSLLYQRVLQGEVVRGELSVDDAFPFHDELQSLGIESSVLVPLRREADTIGVLSLHGTSACYDESESGFLELAAELVTIAIDNARAYEAIEELMHERTRFMVAVAHNMRAPLAASISILELVKDGSLGEVSEEQVGYLQRTDDRLRALDTTIGELLALARTRDRTREMVPVQVDLHVLAASIEETFRDKAGSQSLRFVVAAPADLPTVDSWADLLQQILENLVSNAIKYTPSGGAVEVEMARHGTGEVRIMVRDSGIGIPAAEQSQVFREFFRASNARKVQDTGSGLGLALVKQAVARHGGQLHFASQEGEGTTVVVDIPVRQRRDGVAT